MSKSVNIETLIKSEDKSKKSKKFEKKKKSPSVSKIIDVFSSLAEATDENYDEIVENLKKK